jgi:hypothetical protein
METLPCQVDRIVQTVFAGCVMNLADERRIVDRQKT